MRTPKLEEVKLLPSEGVQELVVHPPVFLHIIKYLLQAYLGTQGVRVMNPPLLDQFSRPPS